MPFVSTHRIPKLMFSFCVVAFCFEGPVRIGFGGYTTETSYVALSAWRLNLIRIPRYHVNVGAGSHRILRVHTVELRSNFAKQPRPVMLRLMLISGGDRYPDY